MSSDMPCGECALGRHYACVDLFGAGAEGCCCGGHFDMTAWAGQDRMVEVVKLAAMDPDKAAGEKPNITVNIMPDQMPKPDRGDSGYIHPDAWPSTANIGELTDPKSTGYKRMVKMYPITGGQVCDWAGKKNCGGGPFPVVGCSNSPASDMHHGPDKNTLNNAKASRGVGETENVHIICSDCHNAWHAANDDAYGPYDRVANQTAPWIPMPTPPWGAHDPVPAEFDELMAEERRRHEQARKRGRDHRGRNAAARGAVNTEIEDDDGPE